MGTSDAGSQYRCGRVGRGIQPPSTPNALLPPHTHAHTPNARFCTFHFVFTDRWTDGRTDGQSLLKICVSATKNRKTARDLLTRHAGLQYCHEQDGRICNFLITDRQMYLRKDKRTNVWIKPVMEWPRWFATKRRRKERFSGNDKKESY